MESTSSLPSGGSCVAYMFFGAAAAIIIGGVAIAGLTHAGGYAEGHNLHFLNHTFTSLKVDDSFNIAGGIGCTIGAIGAIAFGYGLIQGIRVARVQNPPQKDEFFIDTSIDPRNIQIDEISGWHNLGNEQSDEKNKIIFTQKTFDEFARMPTVEGKVGKITKMASKKVCTIKWIDQSGKVYTAYRNNPHRSDDCFFTEEQMHSIKQKLGEENSKKKTQTPPNLDVPGSLASFHASENPDGTYNVNYQVNRLNGQHLATTSVEGLDKTQMEDIQSSFQPKPAPIHHTPSPAPAPAKESKKSFKVNKLENFVNPNPDFTNTNLNQVHWKKQPTMPFWIEKKGIKLENGQFFIGQDDDEFFICKKENDNYHLLYVEAHNDADAIKNNDGRYELTKAEATFVFSKFMSF